MRHQKVKRLAPFLGIALSLTLTACPPDTPQTPTAPSVQPSTFPTSTSQKSEDATSQETTQADNPNLTLKIQGDSSLQNFIVQQTQEICLNELKSLKTLLVLPAKLDASAQSQLKSQGVEVNGNTLTINTEVSNLDALIKGFEVLLPNLPPGEIKAVTHLENTVGKSMGSLSYQIELKQSNGQVTILLKPVSKEKTPNGCTALLAEVSGATLSSTAGGLLVEVPLPTTPSPETPNEELVEDTNKVTSLRLEVSSRFLTEQGQTRQLKAVLLDASGKEITPEGVIVEWLSNRPQDVSVDSQGLAIALVGLGYAEIVARIFGTNIQDKVLFDVTDPNFFTSPSSGGSSGSSSGNSSSGTEEPSPTPTVFPPPNPVPLGEFQVNTFFTSNQLLPSIAMDNEGNFIVVWVSNTQDSSSGGIYAQGFNPDTSFNGTEFRVNTYTTNVQFGPSVAMDADGDFVVTWISGHNGDEYDIFAQRYNSLAVTQGTEFRVNTYTTNTQQEPRIAMDADGDFVIVWESRGDQDGNEFNIFAQRFAADGSPNGTEFQVNTYTTLFQIDPDVALDADGDFIITWLSGGSRNGIFAQRYDSNGIAQGSEFQVNTGTNGFQSPAVATDSGGDFIVVWTGGQDGSSDGIFAQRFTADGSPNGSEFQVNTYTTNSQVRPAVAMDADGDFVVTWESYLQEGTGYYDQSGIYAQRYNPDGSPTGSEFRVNTHVTNTQITSAVAMDIDGDYIVVWQSDYQDSSNGGIFGGNGLLP